VREGWCWWGGCLAGIRPGTADGAWFGYGIGTAVKLSKRLTTVAVADADR